MTPPASPSPKQDGISTKPPPALRAFPSGGNPKKGGEKEVEIGSHQNDVVPRRFFYTIPKSGKLARETLAFRGPGSPTRELA